jgi:hypothetical protein
MGTGIHVRQLEQFDMCTANYVVKHFLCHFSEKFGVHSVDFNDPDRTREAKESSRFLKQLFQDNGFVAEK